MSHPLGKSQSRQSQLPFKTIPGVSLAPGGPSLSPNFFSFTPAWTGVIAREITA